MRAFTASPSFLVLVLVLVISPRAHAQEQENKLVNRLLRPDTAMQNSAQNKKFVATGTTVDRQARVGTFHWQEKSNAKTFSNTRGFSAQEFRARSEFYSGKDSASLTGRTVHKSDLAFGTHAVTGVRNASDAEKKANSREFAGNRPFLGQGKSQKALSQQNRPLTIDEVRELLNKNK